MYLIIEGMPSSGKTTLAKFLAERYNAEYYKSLLPNDVFGNQIMKIREARKNNVEIDLLHIIDLFRNELHIMKMLSMGRTVVRDKCFLSSYAHCLSEYEDLDCETQKSIRMAYDEIYSAMARPDAIVLLDRSLEYSKKMCIAKGDLSLLDEHILGTPERFFLQKSYLANLAKKYFGNCLILLSNNETLEEEVNIVERRIRIC